MHEKIFDKLCDILDDMERKEKLSASDIQLIDWATHAKKSMLAVDEMMGGEQSNRSAYEGRSNRSSYRGSYDYARGRGRRRDSMGRYSSEYSRNYSRDGGKEEYMSQLYEMADNAPDDKSRQNIERMIREMEQA